MDGSGNVYFSDSANHVIRQINTAGVISTYAGNGTGAGTGFGGFAGDNGPATSAQLNSPTDIAIDSNGNLYICDTGNSRVRKVTPGGTITTFAGNGNVVFFRGRWLDRCSSGRAGVHEQAWYNSVAKRTPARGRSRWRQDLQDRKSVV